MSVAVLRRDLVRSASVYALCSKLYANTRLLQANLIATVRATCDSYSDGTHTEEGVVDMYVVVLLQENTEVSQTSCYPLTQHWTC